MEYGLPTAVGSASPDLVARVRLPAPANHWVLESIRLDQGYASQIHP